MRLPRGEAMRPLRGLSLRDRARGEAMRPLRGLSLRDRARGEAMWNLGRHFGQELRLLHPPHHDGMIMERVVDPPAARC